MARMSGKIAIVTGAASGIGLATAKLLVREGARVALVDRDADALATLAASIDGLALPGDVTDAAAVGTAAAAVIARWGRIDALVTAAGISFGKPIVEAEEAEWDRTFAVNVKGTFLWAKAVLPPMIAQRAGAIVTIASQLAIAGGRGNCAYVASKGAVISLTRSVALDYARDGVRCNCVLPGATETPMLERAMARRADPAAARAASRERHAMGRLGRVEEIAAAILHLAGDESAFTTGVALPVDGGWLVA
ncbi:MAG: glucose 1-dehydrogenase [Alphaproteobacteria bacterium]|nr:glucose 1-dehydrogenase [Alphaproteobacteria bacterium]